ncbi:Mur ligase family protein [Kiritimatiellota bacterium B12222]|nr:Mur ligase family protein [Kiritimatiellota bacterium B12222]
MGLPVYILGSGASGLAAARLAASEGREGYLISEKAPAAALLPELSGWGFGWRPELPVDEEGEWILSPGFAEDHAWVTHLRARGVSLIPEFAYGARRLQGQQVAITGSLGKTSMVLLAEALLRDAGYTVTVSGNIGRPVSEVALKAAQGDFHVLELSSFQLEGNEDYRPDRAICLNLFPNHLDRHGSMEAYAQAKARLFSYQTPEDKAVWPEGFPVASACAAQKGNVHELCLPALSGSAFERGGLRENLRMLFAGLEGIPGVSAERQASVIRGFSFPAHRQQRLDIRGAGLVIDDSKSTCLSATRGAVEGTGGALQLVMGGIDKAEDLTQLLPLFRERNPELYLFGRAAKKMRRVWQDSVDVCETHDTLDDALLALWETRTKAQTLLFSPGCASFDQFSGYEARGQHFQALVSRLAAQSPISRNDEKETL